MNRRAFFATTIAPFFSRLLAPAQRMWIWKSRSVGVTVPIAPGSLAALAETERKLLYMQFYKMKMISESELLKKLGL